MQSETDLLLAALADSPDGLTRPELLSRLRERIPYLGPNDVERVLQSAGEAIRVEAGLIYATTPLVGKKVEEANRAALPQRFVAFDLESIVRPVVKEPYREQHVFQLGAVRFGPDSIWVAEQPEVVAFTSLPDEKAETLI